MIVVVNGGIVTIPAAPLAIDLGCSRLGLPISNRVRIGRSTMEGMYGRDIGGIIITAGRWSRVTPRSMLIRR